MKSCSMNKHFKTLEMQRSRILPILESLSLDELWERPQENKWSIGETMYHLYLITRMLRVAAKITIPSTILIARMRKNKPFETEIHDIYKEYKEKKMKGMKAPFILDPPKSVYCKLNFKELNQLLYKETWTISKMVKDIDEEIAGHIVFIDPVAHHPNLIQAVQLLAIHEAHHFRIMENQLEKKVLVE
ncbi:DinB family protein [Ornithinibacillus scapharcae]|uniref:DinB family protein n=1 Tax=Ornithinibacillus scapharcae TaxID=1147159 RepID=UPI000225AB8E|nr:DinB family protein [Ornithinibacillus scapharcae]